MEKISYESYVSAGGDNLVGRKGNAKMKVAIYTYKQKNEI